jgi:hypothetical protein
METSAQHHYDYEFTTTRIVLLVVSIVLWLLLGVARAAGQSDSAGEAVGFLIGSLLFPLALSWIVRALYRLIRRRPVVQPAWTPGLFFGAAVLIMLANAGNAAPS